MSDNNTCRVIITTSCNLKCDYCCNKLPEVQKRFKMSTLDQVINSKYEIFNITGGEPFLTIGKLEKICKELYKRNKTIYVYSNGLLINNRNIRNISKYIEGITIGVHKYDKKSIEHYKELQKIFKAFDLRFKFLMIEELTKLPYKDVFGRDLDMGCNDFGLENVWYLKMNDCMNPKEDWFII